MSVNHLSAPFESPLEEMFARNLEKYMDAAIDLQNQIEIETICGNFRLDFLVNHGNRRIAFECDGLQYHDPSRDEWRDAMILGAKAVDAIYHLRGTDLTYHLEDCLYIISKWEPDLFNQRGKINLETLASKQAIRYSFEKADFRVRIVYMDQSKDMNNPIFILIERQALEIPPGQRAFWKAAFEFARKRGGGNLDRVITDYRQEKWG